LPTDEDSGDYECYCDIVAAAPPATPSLNGANPPQFAIVNAATFYEKRREIANTNSSACSGLNFRLILGGQI
jgi:hypothetical protein